MSTTINGSEKYIVNKNDLFSHKYNLYQQFYVVGIDPKLMYTINESELKTLPEPLVIPKVISKYPSTDLPYLNVPDTIIASHCFPFGIVNSMLDYEEKDLEEKEKITENFIFSIDNQSTEDKTSSLRTNKIYFTCLLFYENIENYRNCINQRKTYYKNDTRNRNILIPKVICLSSFSPYFHQSKEILSSLRKYVNNFNFYNKSMDNVNLYPIEKIVEGLIFRLPLLPRGNNILKLERNSFSHKDYLKENYIIFEETAPNKQPRCITNYSVLLYYFRIEEIFNIIKYIILEEPILFFCDDKEVLSNIIESFVSLLFPLNYPHPVITILPEQNYPLISLSKHFIYGINCKYSEEIVNKKVILDGAKFIRIILVEKRFKSILNSDEPDLNNFSYYTTLQADDNKPLIRISQIEGSAYEDDLKESRYINEKRKISLPKHYFEKCSRRLEKAISEKLKDIQLKNKTKSISDEEKNSIINNEIRENFIYFFTCILLKYQENCVKFEKKNDSNVEYYERGAELEQKYHSDNLKITDLFNCDDFVNSTPYLDRPFYKFFFETKIFFNFIKKKIFALSIQDKFDIMYFDDEINKKLSRETQLKKKETKFLDQDLNILTNTIVVDSLKSGIDENLKKFLTKKENRSKALNYFQYIYYLNDEDDNSIDEETMNQNKEYANQIMFYYFVFPKLLNDDIFYKEKQVPNEKDEKTSDPGILFNQLTETGNKIFQDESYIKNYNMYDYSLNPKCTFKYKYEDYIYILWLRYLAKTFHLVPFSKRKYYFEQMMILLKNNNGIIDENTYIILFNSINKYGDRNMNQDFFMECKKRNYTTFLSLREKAKPENNFIRYIIKDESNNNTNNTKNSSNDNSNYEEEKKFMTFKINLFCSNKKDPKNTDEEDVNNICDEPLPSKPSELFNDTDEYIEFECSKCHKKQELSLSCTYDDENNNKYIIDFGLLSPLSLLKLDWFENSNNLDPAYICETYLEQYLSAVYYFYELNLPCEFLMPSEATENELKEARNVIYTITKVTEKLTVFDDNFNYKCTERTKRTMTKQNAKTNFGPKEKILDRKKTEEDSGKLETPAKSSLKYKQEVKKKNVEFKTKNVKFSGNE